MEKVIPIGFGDVERDGFFAAIAREKVCREIVEARKIGRTPPARIIALSGAFELDDLRAEVGQQLPTERPGQDSRCIKYAYAVKRWVSIRCHCTPRFSVGVIRTPRFSVGVIN